jgi:transcriptional regulator with XRE-family HTH domain
MRVFSGLTSTEGVVELLPHLTGERPEMETQTAIKEFGSLAKQLRLRQKVTLRNFCRQHGFDPSNMSKIERGLLSPPRSADALRNYAEALGLEEGTEEWRTFYDLAALARNEVPADLLSDKEIVGRLPLVFRTMRGERLTDEQKERLIDLIRRT